MKINDYKYKAKRMRDGKIVTGNTEGPSKQIVSQFLSENGMRAIEINVHDTWISKLNQIAVSKVISETDLIFYLKQLSSLLRSGVQLNEACEMLATQQTNKSVRRILYGIYYSVNSGQTLSDAFGEFPKEFPKLLISMIAVGEKMGELDDVLIETTDYFEKQQKLKASIKSTLMMPLIYLIVAVGVGIFLMVGVMPQFEGMYASLGGDLPTVTMLFMNVGNFLRDNAIFILVGIVAFIIGLRILYKKSSRLQMIVSYAVVRMPIFGDLVKLNNLSRIASTVAQLLKNHVPLQDCLDTTRGTIDNRVYQKLLIKAQKNVMNGEYMSTAFEHHFASEIIFTRMMSVGERTGDLGKMMSNLSQFYDDNSDVKIDRLKKSLEPILLIFIYALIVVMILAVMLPSLQLSDQLQ